VIHGAARDGSISESQRGKPGEIATELKAVSGLGALALATLQKWSKRLREGRTNLSDNPRCERLLFMILPKEFAYAERATFHVMQIPLSALQDRKSYMRANSS
jgi:hypothetical protein